MFGVLSHGHSNDSLICLNQCIASRKWKHLRHLHRPQPRSRCVHLDFAHSQYQRLARCRRLSQCLMLSNCITFTQLTCRSAIVRDWPTDLNLSSVRHVTLTNNLVALKDFSSFPPSLRSIQIQIHPRMPNCVSSNWSILRSLSHLRMLTSLHIVFNDVNTGLDNITCRIMAETASILAHFGICFRRSSGMSNSAGVDPAVPVEPPTFLTHLIDDPDNDINFDYEEGDEDDSPGRMPTLVYDHTRPSTAVVTVYRRILTEYLAQYYDRSSPCRLRRDTTISGYKRSLFFKHHCTRSPCSLSGIGRIRSKTTSYSLSNGSYTSMNDRIRQGELRS